MTDLDIAKKMTSLNASASKRGIEFNLSFKKTKQLLLRKTCYFTGVEMNSIDGDPHQRTIDRLDNSKGYTDDNTVACTFRFNQAKGSITLEETNLLYKGLQKKGLI